MEGHPADLQQRIFERLKDGSYVIEVPYAEARELLTEISSLGLMSKSLAPDVLPERVRDALRQAAKRYGD
jgi:predicted DNA-binding transcriptional regulator YafY